MNLSLALKKNLHFVTQFLFGFLLFLTAPDDCFADGDPVEGRKKAQSCLTCHRKGNIVHGEKTPIISGQYQDYLIKALEDYRSGIRQHLIMNQLAAELTDKDIANITAFYSGLSSKLSDSVDKAK